MQPCHLEEELASAGLTDRSESLARLSLPAVRVTTITSDEKLIPVGVSKFGGTPHVPKEFEWPMTKSHQPLRFLGQISFGDFASFHWTGWKVPLPEQGLLAFFVVDPTNFTGSADEVRVLHFPSTAGLMRWDDPFVSSSPSRRWQGPPIQSYPPRSLAFQSTLTLPALCDLHPAHATMSASESETYRVYSRALEGRRPCHQILGHASEGTINPSRACEEQYRMRTRRCMTHFDVWDALDSGSGWTPILQLDSDPLLDWSWGPGRYVQFMIRQEDLHAGNFSNIILI